MITKITVYLTIALLFIPLIAFVFPIIRFMVFYDKPLSRRTQKPLIVGHRGAAGISPENTLAGFKVSMKYSDIVELDVHLTRDDIVVVMHDPNVDRTTNGHGEIVDLDYDYIKGLDAGSWFSNNYNGERVPTLSEVLALIDGKKTVLIELKWPRNGIYEGLVANVIETIQSLNAGAWVELQSFEYSYIEEAMEMAPEIRCHQLIFGYCSFPPIYFDRSLHFGNYKIINGVKSVTIFFPYLSQGLVRKMKSKNLDVATFTINRPGYFNKAVNLGVNAVITDYPNRLNKILSYES